jgi:hypothetical protein
MGSESADSNIALVQSATGDERLSLILDAVSTVHQQQLSAVWTLDAKAAIFLGFLAVLLILNIDNVGVAKGLYFAVSALSTGITVTGIILALSAIRFRDWIVIPDPAGLQRLYESNISVDALRAQLFANIRESVELNAKAAAKKVRTLRWVYRCTIVAFVLSLVTEHNWRLIYG